MSALTKSFQGNRFIQSLPGMDEKIAATVLSEVEDIKQFEHSKKLVAYAGLVPSVFESGTFKVSINRTTKRGSSSLRHSSYMPVPCG